MPDKPPKARRGPGRPKGAKNKPPAEPDLAAAAAQGAKDGATTPPGDAPPSKPSGDRPPGKPKRITKKGTEQIRDAFSELLSLPAVPASIAGDEWLAQHFAQTGPKFADQIATASERNPVLRKWCERMMNGETTAVLLMAAIAYTVPPLIHFNVLPVPEGTLGVPRVASKKRKRPDASPTEGTVWGQRPSPQPQPEPDLSPQVDPSAFGDGAVGAEFSGGENGDGPPTFVETPVE